MHRISNNQKDVITSKNADPNEWFSLLKSKFGGAPWVLRSADIANLNTLKSIARTPAPFNAVIALIQAGEMVNVEEA